MTGEGILNANVQLPTFVIVLRVLHSLQVAGLRVNLI